MKTLKDWNCDVTISSSSPLTVGQTFVIVCEGMTPLESQSEILVFPDNEQVEYDLVVLDKKIENENKIFIKATSWKTGNKNYSDYTLVVGEQVIEVKGPKFQVRSVLEANSEMNPPPGTALSHVPLYAQVLIGVAIAAAFFGVIFWFHRNKQYDRALLKLHSFKTSLSPYNELNKRLRALDIELSKLEDISKGHPYVYTWVRQLEKSLMEYLSLTIQEPLFYYQSTAKKNRVLYKFFRRRKVSAEISQKYLELQIEIKALMRSTQKNQNASGDLIRDLSTTIALTRDFADALQNQLESRDA
ncbi:MAG: hypothetical protein M9899_10580 [Bdellovibrionaceae bacterium]|nr:hypothetical protein [Pseudobdellovibrionaceae bacterium]